MSESEAVPCGRELPQRRPGDPEWLWSQNAMEMIGYLEADYHYQLGTATSAADSDLLVPETLPTADRVCWIEGFLHYFDVMVPGR